MKSLRKVPLILLPVFISLFTTACVSVYQPNPVNTPLLEKEGDIKVAMMIQDGLHLQSAAAVNKNIGVMLNAGYDISSFKKSSLSKNEKEHFLCEGGIGFFDKISENWLWEVYTGYGFGSFNVRRDDHHFWDPSPTNADGNIGRFFIQPAIAYSTEHFVLSFALRSSYVTIFDYEADNDFKLAKYGYFYEPALTMKVGGDKFKFVTQMGLSMARTNSVLTGWEHEPFFGGIGFEVNIGQLIKKD